MQQVALKEQKAALELQRNILDEQKASLEKQQQEMDKAMQEQEKISKNGFFIIADNSRDDNSNDELDANLLYLVDGKDMTKEEMSNIDSKNFESMDVVEDAEMMKKYGDKAKGKDGVIVIKLKKENKK